MAMECPMVEAWMCERAGGFDEDSQRYICPYFDPLNASDQSDDPDEDGFDVDRDGFLSVAEMYTSPEEYQYGMPGNFTTELDGLWCSATLPQGSILTQWPFCFQWRQCLICQHSLCLYRERNRCCW